MPQKSKKKYRIKTKGKGKYKAKKQTKRNKQTHQFPKDMTVFSYKNLKAD